MNTVQQGDGWDGILLPGETILWQGRPVPGIEVTPAMLAKAGFGLVFAGFAVFWMVLASDAPGAFWMFGLIHFSVGVWLMVVALLGQWWRLRYSWYTLTDQRAFVATALPLRRRALTDYPLSADMALSLDTHASDPLGTVWFGWTQGAGRDRRRTGFERIGEAQAVYRMMRQAVRKIATGETVAEDDATPTQDEMTR